MNISKSLKTAATIAWAFAAFQSVSHATFILSSDTEYELVGEFSVTDTVSIGFDSFSFSDLPGYGFDNDFDLSRIAGVVRLAGGAGSDTVEINARDASGIDVTVKKQVLELADYEFNPSAITSLPAGITHDDVQAAHLRQTELLVVDAREAHLQRRYSVLNGFS